MSDVATWAEIVKLDQRVIELESRFRHYHVSQEGTDICKQCGFDLRDIIHKRVRA